MLEKKWFLKQQLRKLQEGGHIPTYQEWLKMSPRQKWNRNVGIARGMLTGAPTIDKIWNAGKALVGGYEPKNPYLVGGEPPPVAPGKIDPRIISELTQQTSKNRFGRAQYIPVNLEKFNRRWAELLDKTQPIKTNQSYEKLVLKQAGDTSKQKALDYYKSNEFIQRAKSAGFKEEEISRLQGELEEMLQNSQTIPVFNLNDPAHAYSQGYFDKQGNLYRNTYINIPRVQGVTEKDLAGILDHEYGHTATNGYNSAGQYLSGLGSYIERKFPMIAKMMKYNESIAPKPDWQVDQLYRFSNQPNAVELLRKMYPELTEEEAAKEIANYKKSSDFMVNYVGNSNELRSRALATKFAADEAKMSPQNFVEQKSNDLAQARELKTFFDRKGLNEYLNKFLSHGVPITGATTVGLSSSTRK